jgi:hydrogenase maturation protease
MTLPTVPANPAVKRACVVGIGGVFGDDRVGWWVVDRLREFKERLAGVGLELASTPADLLGFAEKQQRLIVIDACRGLGGVGSIVRLTWPSPRIEHARHAWGHNITLDQALSIAQNMGNLPAVCELWCIEGGRFELGQPLLPEVESSAEQVAAEILNSLYGS